MKKQVKKVMPTLEEAIAKARKEHQEKLISIRRKYKFLAATPEERLRMLRRSGDLTAGFLWRLIPGKEQFAIAKVAASKASSIDVRINELYSMDMGTLKMADKPIYRVEMSVLPKLWTLLWATQKHGQPTNQLILKVCRKHVSKSIQLLNIVYSNIKSK